jgi:amino acid permease
LVEEMEAIADVDRALEIEEIRDSVLGRPHSRSQSLHHVKLVLDSEEESEVPTEEGGTRTKSDEIASERDPNAKPDILGAIFNLMNYALGAGILALPYAFRQAGVVLGTSLVLIVAVATIFGMFLLLESSRVTKAYGYEQLARISYGDKFAQFVKICIIVDSFGALSAYMIVVAETTTDVMKGYLGPHTIWGNKFLVLFLVATFIMLPLCCLKNINYLGFTSALSLVPLVYLLVLQLYYLIKAGGVQPGVALFNSRFFFSLPIIVFSFSSQQALFPLYTELQERNGTESHIRKVVVWSLVLTAICYLFSGFVGVFTYPTSAKGNVLNNFPEGVLVDVLLITTAVSIVLSFPVILWPARVSTDRLFFLDKPESYLRFILEAVGILALAFLIAVAVPSFSTVLGLFGSLTNTTIGYVLPPLYFLKLDPRMLKTSRVKQAAVALLVIGSLAGLISAGIITEDYISSLINRKPAEGQ